uniref:Uncharacterized protein n=1 Tax=Tetranychus urticae TaxID=32264 RepID=T1KU82_TETUR
MNVFLTLVKPSQIKVAYIDGLKRQNSGLSLFCSNKLQDWSLQLVICFNTTTILIINAMSNCRWLPRLVQQH